MDFEFATEADVVGITETLTLAFADDPVWGPALARSDGRTDHLRPFWRIYVEGAMRNRGQYLTPHAVAVACWTPPGETELSDEQERRLMAVVESGLEPTILDAFNELVERFDAAHPHDQPHAYLGLLATHRAHRGHGYAQQLLAANLAELDARGIPAYLESTNPANDHRYERLGFRPIGSFRAVLDDSVITTMWREPFGATRSDL
jgi:ribosomal protein S18 acetylase RimI-like enzyme